MQDINYRSPQNVHIANKAQGYQSYQVQNEINKNNSNNNMIIVGAIVTLILLSVLFFLFTYVFDSAKIIINPIKKDQSIGETFIINNEDKENVFVVKTIATQEEIALPKNVKKTINSKSEGKIKIFNNSANSQRLIANTRFETNDGKIYRIQEAVTIPANSNVEAKVSSDLIGEIYNIGPSRFTIPGFKGSIKYSQFYAESSESFHGGSLGNQNTVSELELEKGKEQVKKKNLAYLNKKFKEDTPAGFYFGENSLISNFGEFTKVKDDEDISVFIQRATGTAVYFNKNLLIENYLIKKDNISDDTFGSVDVIDSENVSISLLNPDAILDQDKPVRLVISGNVSVLFKPNKSKIIEYYAGRPVVEFEKIIEKFQFVNSARKIVRPFWSSTFPSSYDKIKVEFE